MSRFLNNLKGLGGNIFQELNGARSRVYASLSLTKRPLRRVGALTPGRVLDFGRATGRGAAESSPGKCEVREAGAGGGVFWAEPLGRGR